MSLRGQQQVDELCAATLRALTGDGELHYRGWHLHRGEQPLPMLAPHQRFAADHDGDFVDQRAAADGMALRLLHSDAALNEGLRPQEPVERLFFELLEQLRVESLVPERMPGMAVNLCRRFARWSRHFDDSRLTETTLGVLLFAVAQMCWSRLNARPLPQDIEDMIEPTRAGIAPLLGDALAGLRRWRRDQTRFAPHALEVARIVTASVRGAMAEADETSADKTDEIRSGFALLLDFEPDAADGFVAATSGGSKVFAAAAMRYRVFTTHFDTEVEVAALVRKALLREYRERLDGLVASQGINLARLARMLGALLSRPHRDDWLFGEEEGRIDGRRLAVLVSSPSERRLFRQDRQKPAPECQVSFLIDCSGSMKAHAERVAMLVDILVRALDMAGVETEVLGFTTGAWSGGQACKEWLRQGRPSRPGRLNDVCHMVFKRAGDNWRRARGAIAVLLKVDLYREGIDGEAVDWACTRLLARAAARHILVVVSDGCPMDSATGLANDAFYLDRHLKAVVARREREGAVEILGLGVGLDLDLSPFYRRSVSAGFSRRIDNRLFFELARLLREPR